MQVKLEELKRKKICPILAHHEWDFQSNDPRSDFFRFCIKEMMRWQYRKGRGISYDVLSSLISHFASQRKIDKLEVSSLQLALKSFTNSGLYSKIEELIANAEIQVGIGKGHVIKYTIPALSNLKDETCIITWDDNIRTRDDLRQAYETRVSSVWSFYSINKYPIFYNLYLDGDKVKQVRFKPNQFYIRDSKTFLLKMVDLVEDKGIYPAPLEICRMCNWRDECRTSRIRTKNSQKSW